MKLNLLIILLLLLQNIYAQNGNEYFGSAGEGYSSASLEDSVQLSWRMFTAPMAEDVCAMEENQIRLVSSSPAINLSIGDTYSLRELKIDAIDVHGNFIERIPITVGLPVIDEEFLSYSPYDLELTALKPGNIEIKIAGYCTPSVRKYITLSVIDKTNLIDLDLIGLVFPEGWSYRTDPDSNRDLITLISHREYREIVKLKILTLPQDPDREQLRNLTNIDLSQTLNWQYWGDFSGYQYDYIEEGIYYRQWWLVHNNILLLFAYSSDLPDPPGSKEINGIVASLTANN